MTYSNLMNSLISLFQRTGTSVCSVLLCVLASTTLHASTPLRFMLPAVSAGPVQLEQREYVVPKISPEHYWSNVIIVKTKSMQRPDKSALSFQSLAWQQTLAPLSVQSIRAPFQRSEVAIQEVDPIGIERIFEIRYGLDIDAFDACAMVAANPDVEYACPVYRRFLYFTPNDPKLNSQYALTRIEAQKAWDINTGSTTVVIADIDSGVDFEHEDLAANLWTNPGEIGTDGSGRDKKTNGVDDDGNGFKDDYRGWDYIGSVSYQELLQGTRKPDNDPKVRNANMDGELNHGTATTGCAVAVTNNSKGIASIGYKCKYLPIKCGSDLTGKEIVSGYEGIRYAAALGAKVINCSWGGLGNSQAEQDLINSVTAKGALVVAAAGNDNHNLETTMHYPGNYENVLCVGSTDGSDNKSSFSNYGRRVDVWAPGSGIQCVLSPNTYGNMDGTSFSCPIVSGLCGLVRSLHPDWTPKMVAHQLRSTCDDVVADQASSRPQYYGRINAYRALNENRDFATGTTPGLELSSMKFDGKNELQSIGPVPAVFTIRNYLGRATNATITLTPTTKGIVLSQSTFTLATIPATDSVQLNCTISTQSPTYFRSNNIPVQVVMSAGSYTNYQTINIKVNLESPNTYNDYANTPALNYTAGSAKAPVTFWAIGKTSSGRKTVTHGTLIDSSLTDDLSCVFGLSTSNALVGSSLGRVYRTTNSANSWTSTVVSSIASKVISINMADANNGVLLGTPAGGSWNVGVTSDGGQTWTKSATITSAQSGEVSQSNSVVWVGDNVWIGTSSGRVFYSTNRGTSWQQSSISGAAVITQLAFANNRVGYAISRPTNSVSDAATVYVSIDGGLNWGPSGHVFPANGLHPVYAYAPPASTQFVVVGSLSEVVCTTDTAKTFRPLISEDGLTATAGTAYANSSTVTLYILGKTVGVLKFPLVNASGTPVLQVPSTLVFDSVDVGLNQSKSVQVQNSGTAALSVSTYTLTPDAGTSVADFLLSGTVGQLNAGESGSLFIKFSPTKAGLRSSTLTIQSSVGSKTVAVRGYGREIINDVQSDIITGQSLLQLHPNPSSTQSFISLNTSPGETIELRIVDVQGRVVRDIFSGATNQTTMQFAIPTAELAAGMYVCEMHSARASQRCAFIVQH